MRVRLLIPALVLALSPGLTYAAGDSFCDGDFAARFRAILLDKQLADLEKEKQELISQQSSLARLSGESSDSFQGRRAELYQKNTPKREHLEKAKKALLAEQLKLYNDSLGVRGIKVQIKDYDLAKMLYVGMNDFDPRFKPLTQKLVTMTLEEQSEFFGKIDSLNKLNLSYFGPSRWHAERDFYGKQFSADILDEILTQLSKPKATLDSAVAQVQREIEVQKVGHPGPPPMPERKVVVESPPEPQDGLKLTEEEKATARLKKALFPNGVSQKDYMEFEKKLVVSRESALEELKKNPETSASALAQAKEQVQFARQRYISFLESLETVAKAKGRIADQPSIDDELLSLGQKILDDQGAKYAVEPVLWGNLPSPAILIYPDSSTQIGRLAQTLQKDPGVALVISPHELTNAGGKALYFEGVDLKRVTVGPQVLMGLKADEEGVLMHELKHAWIAKAYAEGKDYIFHGKIRTTDLPTEGRFSIPEPISEVHHDHGYAASADLGEIGTHSLNLKILRAHPDPETVLKYARNGRGIAGMTVEFNRGASRAE
jgi:hypothetical protein